jgi:hypothetical protein
MLLGIDYGITRTVVAAVDRGDYPVVSFHTVDDATQDWYPSLIAVRGNERLFGLEAACCQDDPGWVLLRSFNLTPWDEVYVPFVPILHAVDNLQAIPITRLEREAPWIEERYTCDDHGVIAVEMQNQTCH